MSLERVTARMDEDKDNGFWAYTMMARQFFSTSPVVLLSRLYSSPYIR